MYLIVGATGSLGGAITKVLLAKGEPVRILVRHNSPSEQLAKQGMATTAQSLIDLGAKPIYGDLKDRASLDLACQGVDVIVATANSALRWGDDNVENVDLQGNRNLIDSAKTAGVKHFVFISAQFADPNNPVPFLAAKGKTEEHLRTSGMSYTIIAPNAFMDVWIAMVVGMPAMNGQPVTLVGTGNHKHSFISAVDVVGFTIASIYNPKAINQRLVIGGPEPLSYRDAVAVYEKVLGRPIPIHSVAPGEPVPGLPPSLLEMVTSLDMYDSPINMAETANTFGIQLTSLEQMVRKATASTPA